MSNITLQEWADRNGRKILKVKGCVGVCSTDSALWNLTDYLVSSVAKGTTWLVPMLRITQEEAIAEITRVLTDPNDNRLDYYDRVLRMALPEGMPILNGAIRSDRTDLIGRANLAAIAFWQNALMLVCGNLVDACESLEEAANGFGYTAQGFTWDRDFLVEMLFEDYEILLFGHQTS